MDRTSAEHSTRPLLFFFNEHLNSSRLQSAVDAVINASSSRTVGRVAGTVAILILHLLYLLSYLCCQRRLLESHPCRWALVLVTRGFCQPATTHAGREHTRVKQSFAQHHSSRGQILVLPPMATSTPPYTSGTSKTPSLKPRPATTQRRRR